MQSACLQRRLRMEVLEDKRPLAADLFAEIINGDLIISGSGGDAGLVIDGGFGNGDIRLIATGVGGQTINGINFDDLDDYAVSGTLTRDIIVNFGGDNDTLVIGQINIPRHLNVNMGDGDNEVYLGAIEVSPAPVGPPSEVTVGGNVSINGGSGADSLNFWDLTVTTGNFHFDGGSGDNFVQSQPGYLGDPSFIGNNATFTTGDGNDFALLSAVLVGNNAIVSTGNGSDAIGMEGIEVGNNLIVNGGHGSNEVAISFADVGNNAILNSGNGDDFLGVLGLDVGNQLLINAGGGDDVVYVDFVTVGNITNINLGSGFDTLLMFNSPEAGKGLNIVGSGSNDITLDGVTTSFFINIVTANGSDVVSLHQVDTFNALISTGGGDDVVTILDSTFHFLEVLLGKGDDTLIMGGVDVTGLALILGGKGDNVFEDWGDGVEWDTNEFGWLIMKGF